jgi:hypothetical protein
MKHILVTLLFPLTACSCNGGHSVQSTRDRDRDSAIDEAPKDAIIGPTDASTAMDGGDAQSALGCYADEYWTLAAYGYECPAATPYCCIQVDFAARCESPVIEAYPGQCREHPTTGTEMPCDSSTGAGCTAAKPICCADLDSYTNVRHT